MDNFKKSIQGMRDYFHNLKIDTLPLSPKSKRPIAGMCDWQNRQSEELWEYAESESNIAVRCGGYNNLVVIDCDEKEKVGTIDNVCRLIEVEGYAIGIFPMVQTASGIGRHFYGILNEIPKQNIYQIDDSIGKGEIICGNGGYAIVPPSRMGNGNHYRLINGDFANLPVLDADFVIGKIAKKNLKKTNLVPRDLVVTSERPSITPLAQKLFSKPFKRGKYKSRSEAEQAIIVSLINKGFAIEEIIEIFFAHPYPGKFQELFVRNKNTAINYLRKSYENGLEWATNNISEGRRIGLIAQQWAINRPWKGRTGSSNRAVFLTLTDIAYRSGRVRFNASCREVAELAGINKLTASRALKRLIDKGFIKRSRKILPFNYWFTPLIIQSNTYPLFPPLGECTNYENHDVFRWGALNKSGYEIYYYLSQKPMTVNQLVETTGRSKTTIVRKLTKMNRVINPATGEIFSLVEEVDKVWHLCDDIDLNEIAKYLRSYGALVWQKLQHQKDRGSFIFHPSRRKK